MEAGVRLKPETTETTSANAAAILIVFTLCPLPSALCPLPSALYPSLPSHPISCSITPSRSSYEIPHARPRRPVRRPAGDRVPAGAHEPRVRPRGLHDAQEHPEAAG